MLNHWDFRAVAIFTGNTKPYSDEIVSENTFSRVFEESVDYGDLIWHRDKKYRVVDIIDCGEDWQFQFENELPFNIKTGTRIEIPAEEFHRVIKGKGPLKIKVEEIDEKI